MIQLRPYQTDLVDSLRSAYRDPCKRRIVAVAPTGAGKTVIASRIIQGAVAKERRVLTLAHRSELIEQMSEKLTACDIEHGVIKAGHPKQNLAHPVQVASVQTLARRLDKLTGEMPSHFSASWHKGFDLIVVDECHHTPAGTYQRVLDAWPNAKVLGLTATPYRLDGRGLDDCYDHLEVGIHVSTLIDQGFLVSTVTYAPPAPDELGRVRVRAGDFMVSDSASIMDRQGPIDELVRTRQRLASDRLTVVFCCTVQHAEHVAEAYRAAGVRAAAIDGDTPAELREAALADLRAGRLDVVCNVMLLTEGWDLPAVGCVQLARPTQSRALWRQMVGRGMRTWNDKQDCIVLDHAGNALRFGSPNEDDVYQLHTPPKEKRGRKQVLVCNVAWERCPGCDRLLTQRMAVCPGCGRVLRSYQNNQRGELELEQWGESGEREQFIYFQTLLRDSRPGTASKKFQLSRGKWPPAWMKCAAGVFRGIHGRPPSDGLARFAQKRASELGLQVMHVG
jgi:DNA repair protein RadD